MSDALRTVLASILVLAAAVWVGGFVALVVVARVASATLGAAERVAFFRRLGRVYGVVGNTALAVGLATGIAVLYDHSWDGTLIATAIVAVGVVGATAVGIVQARRMTRLRQSALQRADDTALARRIASGARSAGMLRGLIGLLSIALLVLGVVLAS